jgi:hypothetical protein
VPLGLAYAPPYVPSVAFDAVTGTPYQGQVNSTPYQATLPLTLGPLATAAVVAISCEVGSTTPIAISSVTIGAASFGSALASSINCSVLSGPWDVSLYLYGLLNPPTGSQTITVTFGAGTSWNSIAATSYMGVRSFGTGASTTGTAASASQSIASAAGQMVVQAFTDIVNGGSFSNYSPASGQRVNLAWSSGNGSALVMGDAPGAPTVTISATTPGSDATDGWGSVMLPLIPT